MKEDRPHRWIRCHIEEEYLGDRRKEAKQEKKYVVARDRSKYKKTDQEKYLKNIEQERAQKASSPNLLEGRVLSVMPQDIWVEHCHEKIRCTLKGVLKKDKTHAKNIVAVGDKVQFERASPGEGVIAFVLPRQTILSRADNLSRRKEQIIAANIDQVLIVVSVVHPPLKIPVVDRYIIATQKGHMTPVIVINKIDLLKNSHYDRLERKSQKELVDSAIKAYAAAEIPVICVSCETQEGLDTLKKIMKEKASVFSGQSGVGKSSLINAVTGLDLRTGEVVEKTRKGAHTTTTAELIPLNCGGWCIDTPGIKSFGVWDLERSEIEGYFPEIHEIGSSCKFADCTHTTESHCAVSRAVTEGSLSQIRYDSYCALIDSLNQAHQRR